MLDEHEKAGDRRTQRDAAQRCTQGKWKHRGSVAHQRTLLLTQNRANTDEIFVTAD
jgi:hypothetical protein